MSVDDISPHPQFGVVPADGTSSDDDKKSIGDSSRTMYNDLVQSAYFFNKTLEEYLGKGGKNSLKIPILRGNLLDLHKLFIEVTYRGGIEKVIKDYKCKEVMKTFNFEKPVTNAAHILKKYYLAMLFEFEHVYYFQEPLSSFRVKEEAMNLLVNKSKKGQHEKCVFNGVIVGKFDWGYIANVKVGGEELRGVFYHGTSKSQRRPKRSKSDNEGRPKRHRSGYNFFVSDHYHKLGVQFDEKRGSIVKEIARMWRGLSDADKKVYLKKGQEDLQRYKRQKMEYMSARGVVAATAIGAAVADVGIDAAAVADDENTTLEVVDAVVRAANGVVTTVTDVVVAVTSEPDAAKTDAHRLWELKPRQTDVVVAAAKSKQ